MTFDLTEQLVRAIAFVQEILHHQRRAGVKLPPPEILDDFLQQVAGIGHQLGLERQTAFEGIVAERPLAEAVNGEDRGFVETAHGVAQPADGDFPVRR